MPYNLCAYDGLGPEASGLNHVTVGRDKTKLRNDHFKLTDCPKLAYALLGAVVLDESYSPHPLHFVKM